QPGLLGHGEPCIFHELLDRDAGLTLGALHFGDGGELHGDRNKEPGTRERGGFTADGDVRLSSTVGLRGGDELAEAGLGTECPRARRGTAALWMHVTRSRARRLPLTGRPGRRA